MQVNKTRGNHRATRVDWVALERLADLDDDSTFDRHLGAAFAVRVNDGAALQHEARHGATSRRLPALDSPASRSNSTAMRTETPLATCR